MIADIFNEYRPRLLKYAASCVGHQDAEDVVQEVFVEVCRYPDSVLHAQNIPAYLMQMTKNAVARFARDQEVVTFTTYKKSSSAESEFFSKTEYDRIVDAIENLPDDERIVAKMRFLGEMKLKDIASELSMNYQRAVYIFHRARAKLQEELNNDRDF